MKEFRLFDPDSIAEALKADIVAGLRALADAVETAEIDGRLVKSEGYGLGSRYDDRAHIRVTFDFAAVIRKVVDVSEYKELT